MIIESVLHIKCFKGVNQFYIHMYRNQKTFYSMLPAAFTCISLTIFYSFILKWFAGTGG